MTKLINRAADRLLARLAPSTTADAACYLTGTYYCYCSGGVAYRQRCYYCTGGSTTYYCSSCFASGSC